MVGRRKPLGDTMYQLLPQQDPPVKTTTYFYYNPTIALEAWWESRATPHTGARLYNGRATISEFQPKFLVAALLNLFCGYTGHWSPCPVPLYYISSTFLPANQILDDHHLVGRLTTNPPPRSLLCSQHHHVQCLLPHFLNLSSC